MNRESVLEAASLSSMLSQFIPSLNDTNPIRTIHCFAFILQFYYRLLPTFMIVRKIDVHTVSPRSLPLTTPYQLPATKNPLTFCKLIFSRFTRGVVTQIGEFPLLHLMFTQTRIKNHSRGASNFLVCLEFISVHRLIKFSPLLCVRE